MVNCLALSILLQHANNLTTERLAGRWLKDPPVPVFHNGKQIPLISLPKAEDILRTREPFLPPIPPPADQADRQEITNKQSIP